MPQLASSAQFRHALYYSAGSNDLPRQVVTADLRNIGILDLVIADYLSNRVSVLLGNGDGTFQKPLRFPVSSPIGIATGDMNGDGKPDLVIIESGGTGKSLLAVFLGNGDGTFRQAGTGLLGIYSANVALADFNSDGHLDVAVANRGFDRPGSVMVFLGDGKGNVKDRITYKVAGGPWGIAAGDLNRDGHPDLAAALDLAGSVAVLINDGTGHFLKPVTYSAGGGEVVDVKIADLRHDGRNDLVIANLSAGMVVLLNKGDGTFGKPAIYRPCAGQCSAGPEACTVADLNLDGKLDVACSASIDDSYFFYGKGDGTFGTAIAIADTIKNQGGYSIASGDFNHDGAPDLAIPIEYDGKVAILLNTQ
ncbi:MAG: VCBS repeat-containing protein [Terriglobales bacterium]